MKKFIITVAVAGFLALAGSASASTFVYTSGLIKVGSMGSQVADLQTCMNGLGYSTGIVDGKFGPMTKSGVMAFQASKGLAVDGIIGSQTGPHFTAACAEGSTGGVTLPEGCTSTEGYSPATGDKCDGSDSSSNTDFNTNNGEEATYTGFDVDDAADTTIDEGTKKAELGTITFKNEDSDVLLERMDVILVNGLTATAGTDEEDAWKAFDKLYVYVDGDMVASMDSDTKADWKDRVIAAASYNDNDNRFRFSGLNKVLKKNTDHEIMVKADINSSVDMSSNGDEWVMVVNPTTLRLVDEAGITSYLNEEDGNVEDFTAAFSIVAEGNQDELQVKSSTNDPDATTFEVKSGSESDEYMTFAFDVEADKDGGDLEVSEFTLSAVTGVKDFDVVVKDVTLKIGGEEEKYDVAKSTGLSSTAATLVFDFDGKEININSGDTEEAKVYVTFKSTNNQTAYVNGETIKFSVSAANVNAWDVDGADTLTTTQLTGSATGDTHQLSEEGVIVTLKNASVSTTVDQNGEIKTATYTMDVELEAFGDTFYTSKSALKANTIPAAPAAGSQSALAFSVEDSADAVVANESTAFALSSTASTDTGAWRIDEGEKETITLTATVSIAAAGTDTYTRIQLNQVKVFTDNALTNGAQTVSLLPVEDYESALQLINNL